MSRLLTARTVRMKQYYPVHEKPSEELTLYAELEHKTLEELEEDNDKLDALVEIEDNVTNRSYLQGEPRTQQRLKPLKAAN